MVATKNSYKICELFTEMTVNELFDVNGGAARILDHGDVQEARPPKVSYKEIESKKDLMEISVDGHCGIKFGKLGNIEEIDVDGKVTIKIDKSTRIERLSGE